MSQEMISIIMGVYNAEDTVSDAIESILRQTYTNWEFIICDDASTDGTYAILKNYQEKYPDKFIVLKNKENRRLAYSLNRCLAVANGPLIGRMDADDISLPNRFEEQVQFLKANPDIDLVGTAYQKFDDNGLKSILYRIDFPDQYAMRNSTPFIHPTVLTYKYVYDALEGYTVSSLTARAEDHELWFRFFAAGFKGANMHKVLHLFREDEKAMTKRSARNRIRSLQLTIEGYRMLNFPLHWYIEAFVITLAKCLVPFQMQWIYHQFRAGRYKRQNA